MKVEEIQTNKIRAYSFLKLEESSVIPNDETLLEFTQYWVYIFDDIKFYKLIRYVQKERDLCLLRTVIRSSRSVWNQLFRRRYIFFYLAGGSASSQFDSILNQRFGQLKKEVPDLSQALSQSVNHSERCPTPKVNTFSVEEF